MYRNMTFTELFHTVFDESGQVKACGRDACLELIDRLERFTGDTFGDDKGRLILPDAYNTGQLYL